MEECKLARTSTCGTGPIPQVLLVVVVAVVKTVAVYLVNDRVTETGSAMIHICFV